MTTSQPSSVVAVGGAPASFTTTPNGTPDSYQWYKDGTSITGATAATYTIGAVTAADEGDYSCILQTSCGAVGTETANLSLAVHIPDANFKSFLVATYDSDVDGEISKAEAAAVSGTMECSSKGIADLTGISFFTGVTNLNCHYNQLEVLPDLSALTNLTHLYCYNNQLTTLPDFSALTNLTHLYCYNNQLTALPELNTLTSLSRLYCYDNLLTALPALNSLNSLTRLYCYNNLLTVLPALNSLNSLTYLNCSANQLTGLPALNSLTSLTYLSCYSNQLTALPVLSSLTSLTYLSCYSNYLTALPALSSLTSLTYLSAYSNDLTALPNLSSLTSLTDLYCYDSYLTEFPDLSGLNSLNTVKFEGNNFVEDDCPDILRTLNMDIPTFTYNPQRDDTILTCPCVQPSISSQTPDTAYCQGSTEQLTVTAGGTAPFFYQWYKGTAIPGATNATLEISAIAQGDAGNYHCVVTNFCGTVTGGVTSITVEMQLSVSPQPSSVAVVEGASTSFTTGAGGALASYQWNKDGTPIDGATAATYTLNPVVAADVGDYSCTLQNSCGSVETETASLTLGVHIPDANFKSFLVGSYDSNGDGEISLAEAAAVSGTMNCSGLGIVDLTGISAFINLTVLDCQSNGLTALPDLSALTNLTILDCQSNDLTALPDLSALTNLTKLDCIRNELTTLPSLSALTSLTHLYAYSNKLTAVPDLVGRNSMLQARIYGNQFAAEDCPLIRSILEDGPVFFIYNTQSDGSTLDCYCEPPEISTHPNHAFTGEGPVTFTVAANGTTIDYQWEKDGVPIDEATAASYTINTVTAADQGNYRCLVENGCGTDESDAAILSTRSLELPLEVTGSRNALIEFPLDLYQLAEGFTSFDFTLVYDSQMMQFSELDITDTICSDCIVFSNPIDPDRLQVVGISSTPIVPSGALMRFQFTVDSGVSYAVCSDLLLENVTFNSAQTITQEGQFCGCLKGDADGNGIVEVADAALVQQVADGIPTPYDPIEESCIDVDCNGEVEAQDAGLILQYTLGQIPEFCPGSLEQKPTTEVQLEVADLCLEGGQRFTLDINASRLLPADRVFGYQFSLDYDEELLSFDGFEIEGSLSQDWMALVNDSTPGRYTLSAIHSEPMAGEGLLIRLHGFAWQAEGVSELKWSQFLLGDGTPATVAPSAMAYIAWNGPSEEEVLSILCPRDGHSRPSAAKLFGNSCESQQVKILSRPSMGTVAMQTNQFIYSAGSELGVDAFSFQYSNVGDPLLGRYATVRILDAHFFDALASWPNSSLLGMVGAIDFPENSEIEGVFEP